jgi:hypothetical protein
MSLLAPKHPSQTLKMTAPTIMSATPPPTESAVLGMYMHLRIFLGSISNMQSFGDGLTFKQTYPITQLLSERERVGCKWFLSRTSGAWWVSLRTKQEGGVGDLERQLLVPSIIFLGMELMALNDNGRAVNSDTRVNLRNKHQCSPKCLSRCLYTRNAFKHLNRFFLYTFTKMLRAPPHHSPFDNRQTLHQW